MTVILVLLFICVMLSIDGIRQYRAKHTANLALPSDAYVHEWGVTMAEGGQKVENPPQIREVICPSCGAMKESK